MLASRLSEDPNRSVLLVEAGSDHPDIRTLPRDVMDASEPTVAHDWGYFADADLDRGIPLPRARLMGGCSSTNACFALRGAPEDYDAWATLGNPGWGFADVLAEEVGITKQSVNDLLGHLEGRGYLVRVPEPVDGRARVIRLTAKGAASDGRSTPRRKRPSCGSPRASGRVASPNCAAPNSCWPS